MRLPGLGDGGSRVDNSEGEGKEVLALAWEALSHCCLAFKGHSVNMSNFTHAQFKAVENLYSRIGAHFVIYNNNVYLVCLKENNTFVVNPDHFKFKMLTGNACDTKSQ